LKENFDRFNYAIHKEKRMADFRRVATALVVAALLMGFASTAVAQQPPPFACTATAAVVPLLRSEGLTELVGDIILNCTGGTPIAADAEIPVANFRVFMGANITSRLIGRNTSTDSEALLLIDEPGTPGGPTLTAPANSVFGCPGSLGGTCVNDGTVPNLYQGLVSGNQLDFIGVPVNPPGTTANRIFRITNVRVNANALGTSTTGIPIAVEAFITTSGPTSVPLTNESVVVGRVQTGLTTLLRNAAGTGNIGSGGIPVRQCQSIGRATRQARLRFTENFPTAFKIRVQGDPATPVQTVPGIIYNTESGLHITTVAAGGRVAGLADFGTRLRASFNNIPTGMQVWVSVINIDGLANTPPYAELTALSEAGSLLPFSPIAATNDGLIQVPLTNGSGVAVWEVLTTSTQAFETLDFAVHFVATADPGNNIPALGTGTVNQSFAPVAPAAFTLAAGGSASSGLPIPRFVDISVARNLVVVSACRTNLLFPFVTNQGGFDTGLAIANTSADPFGTSPQSGTCTWNFFGDNAPASVDTGVVAGGTVLAAVVSDPLMAPGFQGYVIAVCNFEFAHGFAFVSDVGARNLAMGYLALILPEPARQPTGGILPGGAFGEVLGQ